MLWLKDKKRIDWLSKYENFDKVMIYYVAHMDFAGHLFIKENFREIIDKLMEENKGD